MSYAGDKDHHLSDQAGSCGCFAAPDHFLIFDKALGMDDNFAEVSLLVCSACAQPWLRYFYELEAFTASGRWYLGAITVEQAALTTAAEAKSMLEGLSWYFFGGSYFGGRSGRSSGRIFLNP